MFSFSLQLHCTIDSENAQEQNFSLLTATVATVAFSVGGDDGDDEIRGVKAPSPSSPIVTGAS